jgi:hypothetical protein
VDDAHLGDRGIDSTHDYYDDHAGTRKDDHHLCTWQDHQESDRGETEVSERLQADFDNYVRQGIVD